MQRTSQGSGAKAQAILDGRGQKLRWLSRSLKFGFRFHSPKNSAVRPPVEMPIFFGKKCFLGKKGF